MHYELPQDEFNRIESCMHQIDLMAGLCALITAGHNAITIEGLGSFLSAQQEALNATLKTVEERRNAQRVLNQEAATAIVNKPATMEISAGLLVRIMKVCSGETRDEKAVMELHDELYDATVLHGEGAPLKALYSALDSQGFDITSTIRNGDSTFTITQAKPKKAAQPKEPPKAPARKRDRLAASA